MIRPQLQRYTGFHNYIPSLTFACYTYRYTAIERLSGDTKPENTYRQGCYLSITGGGSGGVPMLFATDAWENRMHRARMGAFIKACGLVEQRDWALSTHASGDFYR